MKTLEEILLENKDKVEQWSYLGDSVNVILVDNLMNTDMSISVITDNPFILEAYFKNTVKLEESKYYEILNNYLDNKAYLAKELIRQENEAKARNERKGEIIKLLVMDKVTKEQKEEKFVIIDEDYQEYLLDKEFKFEAYKPMLSDRFSEENKYNYYKVFNELITHYYCVSKSEDLI